MSDVERRFTSWLELMAELLASPVAGDFPRGTVEAALVASFGCHVVWSWRDARGQTGFDPGQHADLRAGAPALLEAWECNGGLDRHPLLRWFAATGDSTAMSVGRVPRSMACPRGSALLRELLSPYGCEQQLSIPVRIDGPVHLAYVLAQPDEDFGAEDLALARRIQPLLQLVDKQSEVLADRRATNGAGLTGRETTILCLLAEDLTAEAIARRLGVSPRTVHKHLENLYRKLGARDRLQAVLVARDAALVAPTSRIPAQRGGSGGPLSLHHDDQHRSREDPCVRPGRAP